MVPVFQDETHGFRNGTSFVRSAVDVIDRDRVGQSSSSQSVCLDIVSADEHAGGSGIEKGID